jgi:hypothetical protein
MMCSIDLVRPDITKMFWHLADVTSHEVVAIQQGNKDNCHD